MKPSQVRTEQPIAAKGKRGRGRPFTRNDPRINRGGVPSDIRAFHNWMREEFAKCLQEAAADGLNNGAHIVRRLIQMAKDGDMKAIEYVLDRMSGKLIHAVEVRSTSSFDFSFMSEADRIRALESVDRIRRMTEQDARMEQTSKPPELPFGECMSPEPKRLNKIGANRPHGLHRSQCFTCCNIGV